MLAGFRRLFTEHPDMRGKSDQGFWLTFVGALVFLGTFMFSPRMCVWLPFWVPNWAASSIMRDDTWKQAGICFAPPIQAASSKRCLGSIWRRPIGKYCRITRQPQLIQRKIRDASSPCWHGRYAFS